VTETNGDGCSARRNIAEEDVGVVDLSESGNVLGNRNPLNNFVAAGRVGLDMEWCGGGSNAVTSKNEPTQRHVKHEDLGASPQMAKRLEHILRSKE
jgi:hypothetical protein